MAADVLVVYASKHGSTEQVARKVAEKLRDAGYTTRVERARAVKHLDGCRSVVVGGSLSQGGELVLEPIRHAVRRATRQFTTEMTAVVPAELGDRAEVLGALALVMKDASKHFSLRLEAPV